MSRVLWPLKALLCMLCLTTSLAFVGCGAGDDGDGGDNPAPDNLARVTSPEGSSLTLTYPNGKVEEITSTTIIGWESVQLLNGNYAVILRFNGLGEQYWLRYSLNASLKWEQEVYREYGLSGQKLALEDTNDLAGVTAEFYTTDDEPFRNNALGTVELRQNVEHNGTTYDLIGIIDVQWMTAEGVATMKGNLWVQEL